jgi:hypothetical protein
MLVPPAALERAMTIREVVLRAMSGAISWMQLPRNTTDRLVRLSRSWTVPDTSDVLEQVSGHLVGWPSRMGTTGRSPTAQLMLTIE